MTSPEDTLSEISLSLDKAFIESIRHGFDAMKETLIEVREKLLEKNVGNSVAESEIVKCELERLLVGSIKLGRDWNESYEIYNRRKEKGFCNPVREFLVFQTLLSSQISADKLEDVIDRCEKLEIELRDLHEGSRECLEQLSKKLSEIKR